MPIGGAKGGSDSWTFEFTEAKLDAIMTNIHKTTFETANEYGYSVTIPPAPSLQTTNIASNPLIFWSDDGLNRTLQTTADLNWANVISLNWTNNSSNPRQIGYQITDVSISSSAFFRLQ